MSITIPEGMTTARVDDLRRQEAHRAGELAAAGVLGRLWRVPGEWANWGLWVAADEPSLRDALATLPLYPYIALEVHQLDPHPSDPRAARVGSPFASAGAQGPRRDLSSAPQGDPPISPLVARRAAERGVDLGTVSGTGPGGRIRLTDVEGASPTVAPVPAPQPFAPRIPVLPPLPALRDPRARAIPAGTDADMRTIAVEIDVTALAESVADERASRRSAVDAAVGEALAVHPRMNAETRGTFTVSEGAGSGILFVTPALGRAQAAALAVGAVSRRPVVVASPLGEEAISIRSVIIAALTYDPAIIDAVEAASFLETIGTLLREFPSRDASGRGAHPRDNEN